MGKKQKQESFEGNCVISCSLRLTDGLKGRSSELYSDGARCFVINTCKKKGKVIPLQARCGPQGGRGIALLFHDPGTRRG